MWNFIKKYIFLLFLIGTLGHLESSGQEHPLSKHDSSLVVKYLAQYQNYLHEHNNLKDASHYLNEVAFIYWEHNQYLQAIKYYDMSLEINQDIENENGIAMINNNLGMLHADVLNYEKSYGYFKKTLAARKSKGETVGSISAMINLSVVLNNLERYEESIDYLQEALNLSREMNDVNQMKSCYGMLCETYEKAGNAKESIYYFDLYKTFTQMAQDEEIDKIMIDYSEEKLLKQQLEKENLKNQLEIEAKQKRIREIELRNISVDKKLSQYDSLNQSLYANLTQKETQLELLKQNSIINQLQKDQEIQEQMIALEKEKNFQKLTLFVLIVTGLVLSMVILSFVRTKKHAKSLKEKNQEIEIQKENLAELNESLEKKVSKRTKHLKQANEKLKKQIFQNNHLIRRPAANIQGLLNLIQSKDPNLDMTHEELVDLLVKSADELDEAIKNSHRSLTEKESKLVKSEQPAH